MNSTTIILVLISLAAGAPQNYNYGYDSRSNYRSGDIITQTRAMADAVLSTLNDLANTPASAAYINRIINDEDNVCLNSIQEGIVSIEYAVQLVEAAGDDIKELVFKVENFQRLSEPSEVVREVGNILRVLEPLIKNLTPKTGLICQEKATPQQAFGSLQSLAFIINDLANDNQFDFSSGTKRKLKESSNVVVEVTTFLQKLGENFDELDQFCTSDKQYNLESLRAIGETMADLADLFESLGDTKNVNNLRRGKAFVNKLVRELNTIGDLGLGDLDCSRPGDFSLAADTLDDVATLIDEVGLEELQKQLGVDLNIADYFGQNTGNNGRSYINYSNNNNRYQNSYGSSIYNGRRTSFGNSGYRNLGFGRSDTPSVLISSGGSDDIIEQTRDLANTVKSTLRKLAKDPKSAVYVNKIINDKNNVCIQDLDEAIAEIEYGTQLVESAGDDIKKLVYKVENLQKLSKPDPADVVREVGNVFRIIEPLVDNLSPDSRFICQGKATPQQAFDSLKNIAFMFNDLSADTQFDFTSNTRRQLKKSADADGAVTKFLEKLSRNFSNLKQICTSDKQYNLNSLSAVGETMDDLTEVFTTLGDSRNAQRIGKGKAFANKVVRELTKIGEVGLGDLDCSRPGDFSVAADTMDDVATLIDEVGLEQLQKQLGVDLSLLDL